jgi:hypothetical protein
MRFEAVWVLIGATMNFNSNEGRGNNKFPIGVRVRALKSLHMKLW